MCCRGLLLINRASTTYGRRSEKGALCAGLKSRAFGERRWRERSCGIRYRFRGLLLRNAAGSRSVSDRFHSHSKPSWCTVECVKILRGRLKAKRTILRTEPLHSCLGQQLEEMEPVEPLNRGQCQHAAARAEEAKLLVNGFAQA